MKYQENILQLIGNTPLIKLKYPSEITNCQIFGKAEFLNPSGSVKDRIALGIIEEAEQKQELTKPGICVEGTSGNTGIGLAMVNNIKGYETIIVLPKTICIEKRIRLINMGVEIHVAEDKPYPDPANYRIVAKNLAEKLSKTSGKSVFFPNQYDNTSNYKIHLETTAKEILTQTDGKIDGFICGIGTGGTLSGISIRLKEFNKNIKIACSDSQGSAMYHYINDSNLKVKGEEILMEGVGQTKITQNVVPGQIDQAFYITDKEVLETLYTLMKEEGLFLGLSSGVNVAGAIKLAKELGPGHNIVTMLCDNSYNYHSKMFNTELLKSQDILLPNWIKKPTFL